MFLPLNFKVSQFTLIFKLTTDTRNTHGQRPFDIKLKGLKKYL